MKSGMRPFMKFSVSSAAVTPPTLTSMDSRRPPRNCAARRRLTRSEGGLILGELFGITVAGPRSCGVDPHG